MTCSKFGWIMAVLMLTSACSSPPPARSHYLLDKNMSAYQSAKESEPVVVSLDRIHLARYLQQNQMTIIDNNQLQFSSSHLWAEELKHGISRALTNDMRTFSAYELINANQSAFEPSAYQLHLNIDHFAPTTDGSVILAGEYRVFEQKALLDTQTFYFTLTLEQDGFSHAVSLQRQLLAELAQDLIKHLNQLKHTSGA